MTKNGLFKTKSRRLPTLVIFSALVISVTAAELSPADTGALLQKLKEHRAKYSSFTADFTEERTTHLLTKPLVSRGEIAFQSPNKFRRELKGNTPSVTVTDGTKLWIYYPSFKTAELYTLGQRQFFDDSIAALTAGLNFENIANYYRCHAFREDNAYRLALTPRSGGLKRMVKELGVWVDDDYQIQKTEARLPKDDLVITTYRNQRPTPLPASTFEFTPPSGTEISQPLGK